jgi:hypothetical protein
MSKRSFLKLLAAGAMLPAAAMFAGAPAQAQTPAEVKVGLLVPLSASMRAPARSCAWVPEMAIERINAQGGVKALGGAKLKLVCSTLVTRPEKAKNAAQRMVAQETDLVAASGSYLSSFTLAVTEVTERANLPMLTLSYSDLITSRGFKYVFQTSADGGIAGRAVAAGDRQDRGSGYWDQAQDCRYHHRQHRCVGGVRQADEGAPAEGAGHRAGGGRDLHTAAVRRHAPRPEGARGAARLLFFLPTVISTPSWCWRR